MSENRPLSHYLYLLFLALVWGSSFLVIKTVTTSIPPLTIAATRISIGALLIAAYVLLKREKLPSHSSIWIKGSIIGLIGTGIPFALISWAVKYINSGTAAICMSIIPLSVFIMAHFTTHDEKMTWPGLLGIVSGVCGIIVLFYDTLQVNDTNGLGTYALIAMLVSAFGYALANILIKRYVKTDPINTSFVMLTTSAIILWPITLIFEQPFSIVIESSEIFSLLYLGVFPTGIATMVLVIFNQKAGPTFVSYNTYLIPIVGVFAGYIWLDEILNEAVFLSIMFIMIGIFIAQRQNKSKIR
ncbi:MAG: DMT family transporter [Kordiimonadaceae bacterium]|jgi:drug/metabolite transporter (DMT)-like permease|nr:DMT family transporter [Kordiimonadaceae bacterium]MBT6033494.1 DMT family transporter [Kordiimonadaceae bacterium]